MAVAAEGGGALPLPRAAVISTRVAYAASMGGTTSTSSSHLPMSGSG